MRAGAIVAAAAVSCLLVTVQPAEGSFVGRNGKIAFSERGEAIYVANADGSGLTKLVDAVGVDMEPAWSPDGSKIAFVSSRSGNYELYTMNADGSGLRRLTFTGSNELAPAWSPDGKKLAFVSDRDDWSYEVYVMNLADVRTTRLTTSPTRESAPVWSPDGAKIAYVSSWDSADIWVMNADGSGKTAVVTTRWDENDPDWSPDGTRIVFESSRDYNADVYVVNADGSGETRLTRGSVPEYEPVWSPDGARILFRAGLATSEPAFELVTMKPDGSDRRSLGISGQPDGPNWQPVRAPGDVTPPDVKLSTPPDGAVYGVHDTVAASYACSDAGSGVAFCTGTAANAAAIDTSSVGTKRFTVTAVDFAGNRRTTTSSYTVVDRSAPLIFVWRPAQGSSVGLGQVAAADYSCQDEPGGSGLSSCVGTVPNGTPIDTSSMGTKSFTITAEDGAGNRRVVNLTYQVVDRSAPAVRIVSPAVGTVYALGSRALAEYECADESNGSGVASCVGSVPSGFPLDTSSAGTKSLSVLARDAAGNSVVITRSYVVVRSGPALARVEAARDALLARRPALHTTSARRALDRAVESLDLALAPERWSPEGFLVGDERGHVALRALRTAVGRLHWPPQRGDFELRDAAAAERAEIVATMGAIARARFEAVRAVSGDEEWLRAYLWAVERHLDLGDALASGAGGRVGEPAAEKSVRATLHYLVAWERLIGKAPLAAP